MIYLDNCATTPLDGEVREAMEPYLRGAFGNPSSQHAAGRVAAEALTGARDTVARLLSARPEQIYFTSGGTEGCNAAVKGVILNALKGGKKGHAVISAIEHPAVYEAAADLVPFGCEVTFVQPDGGGAVRPEAVAAAMRPDTVLCAVMHVNNETGVIQPVGEIYRVCCERGVFFFCDCVQSAGVLPFPEADALCFSAHKFYGPKGAGALYIKDPSRVSRLMSGGGQERSMRGGTQNVAAAVGLATALKRASESAEENSRAAAELKARLIKGAERIGGVRINGENAVPRIANLSFEGCDGENLLFCLDLKGVCVSVGSACSAGAATPSRVIAASWGEERAKSALRFSFGKYNTAEEIDFTLAALDEAASKIRRERRK